MLRRFGVNYAIFSIVIDIVLTLVALGLAMYLVRYIPASLTTVSYTHLDVYKRQSLTFVMWLMWGVALAAARLIPAQQPAIAPAAQPIDQERHCPDA